jgi:excisionase family DNA binding protein
MRSSLRGLSRERGTGISTLLEELELRVHELSEQDLLEAIGRTARVDAILRARYTLLMPAPPSPPPTIPRYLDAAEAAEYLGVSRSTVVRLAISGKLVCCRPSKGTVRFDRRDLDAYMERARG